MTIHDRVIAGALAGALAAIAYAIEQEIDLRAFHHYADDLTLVGRLLTAEDKLIRPIGLGVHLFNGVAVGLSYALIAHDRLPGPPIVRGITYAMAENTLLYPLALLQERHPAIREGKLARYWNRTAFAQETLRHVAFGVVLGPLTQRLLHTRQGVAGP